MVVINGNVSGGIAVSKFARMVPLKYLCLLYQVVCLGGIAVTKFAGMVPLKYSCLFYQAVCLDLSTFTTRIFS